jgi:thiol-disulfide isomerase/thioredoxin
VRKLVVVLYTAFLLGANGLGANPVAADVAALRDGDMKKLAIHMSPAPVPEVRLLDAADAPRSLADYRGKWVVLNFWATWCAPCRHEMPSLDRLQAAMPEIAVVPVATGRNAVAGIERFFAEAEIKNLPILRDPKSELARAMGVMGLPVTVILNPEGKEVARLIGDAEWDSDSAKAVLRALAAGQ